MVGLSAARRAVLPAPTLPLAYFGGAHLALALAFATLLVRPGLGISAVLLELGTLGLAAPLVAGWPRGRGDVGLRSHGDSRIGRRAHA